MTERGTVALKMRYLGGTFVGQDLCECRISVAENAVHVLVRRAGIVRRQRFIEDPGEVETLKSKLRNYLARMKALNRWKWTRIRPGTVYITIYYPSASWTSKTGQCRLFSGLDTF